MSSAHDGTPAGVHHNRDLVAGLRELADFISNHPELPGAYYATVSFGSGLKGPDARQRLVDLAEALNGRAEESDSWDHTEVRIEGVFPGDVRVFASAKKRALVSAPPIPEPDPIIHPANKAEVAA